MQFTLTLTVDATVADPATAPISVCLIKTGSSIHTGIGETNAPFCSTNENKEADSFFQSLSSYRLLLQRNHSFPSFSL